MPTSGNSGIIANGGIASITQPGEACADLNVGYGGVEMTGGGLSAGVESIGGVGGGSFVQSGGVNQTAGGAEGGGLLVGPGYGIGSYVLTGSGQLINLTGCSIGYNNPGTFVQSGGTNVVSGFGNYNEFYLGGYGGGNYVMSAGQLIVNTPMFLGWSGGGTLAGLGGMSVLSRGLPKLVHRLRPVYLPLVMLTLTWEATLPAEVIRLAAEPWRWAKCGAAGVQASSISMAGCSARPVRRRRQFFQRPDGRTTSRAAGRTLTRMARTPRSASLFWMVVEAVV